MAEYIEERETLINKHFPLFFGLIITLSVFNLFYNLNNEYIEDYDEAIYGVAAYEMIENNNYIVNTFLNKPDYWNLKPPLGLWLISLSYRTFGISNFSLRFPSAFAALLTIVLTIIFAKLVFNKEVSLLSGLILATSKPFIDEHSARTGNYDSLLAFFILAFIFFLWLYENKKNILFFYLSGLTISLIFLLKSFAAAFPIFILTFYLMLDKKYKNIRLKEYMLFLLAAIVPLFPWVFFRYKYDGLKFFRTMISYDLFSESTRALEGHSGNMFYYFNVLLREYIPWMFILLVLPFYRFFHNKKNKFGNMKLKELSELYKEKLIITAVVIPFLIATLVQTKLTWYLNPVYPPLAIIIAWFLPDIVKVSIARQQRNVSRLIIIFISFTFLTAEYLTIEDYIVIKNRDKYSKQEILLSFKPEKYKSDSVIYDLGKSRRSEIFAAKVIKGYNFRRIRSIDLFMIKSGHNFLILKNAPEEIEKIRRNKLSIVAENKYWIIAEKYSAGVISSNL